MLKTCSFCSQEKPIAEFYGNTGGKLGKRSTCKPCTNEDNRKRWREKSKDWAAVVRNRALKRHYGIDHATYERMLAEQGGKCAVCGSDTPGRGNKHFSVDHCHLTGKVRGILCSPCNTALGYIERTGDAGLLIRKLAAYLGSNP